MTDATPSPSSISLWDKIDIYPAFVESLLKTLVTAILSPFRGPDTLKSTGKHIVVALVRNVIGRMSPQQLQSIAGTTIGNYSAWAKAQHINPEVVDLPKAKTKAFWIGNPSASTVMLYFHGGGWGMPGSAGHFSFVSRIVSSATESGKSFAALVLQYDLAPAKQYPHQLRQCVELLRYVLMDLHKSPHQIVLGGDSAGGNMVFGVLSHLLHDHPAIEPLEISAPIRAAFAASPVAAFTSEFKNELRDPAPASTIKTWVKNYLGSGEADRWNDPSRTDAVWWKGVENVAKQILITIAAGEMMADDTREFATTLQAACGNDFTLFQSQNDFHAEPAIGADLGLDECEASKLIKSWLVERL